MSKLAKLLIVLGVCVGALGSSGFHTPYSRRDDASPPGAEALAWPLFLVGLALLGAGGFVAWSGRRESVRDPHRARSSLSAHAGKLMQIRDTVAALDDQRTELSAGEARERIGALLSGDLFDFTSNSDEFVTLLGFKEYARLWEGVANAERLLARCWSMATDGYVEQGIEELPLARKNLDHAVEVMNELASSG